MRRIDADALEARMYHEAFETDTDMQRWDSGCWIRYKMFEKAIAEAPTVEPERKKGKLIIGKYRLTCDQCRFTYPNKLMDEMGVVNYCPNCGSDMRGEEE